MHTKIGYIVLLIFLTFSCSSTSKTVLDYDSKKFKEKDGKLFYAVKSGSSSEVSRALRDNPNINVADRLGQTAFMWACWNGNLEIIEILLNHDDRNITQRTKGYRPLNVKAESNDKNPELRYNALFCYVMSNGINPHDERSKNILKRIIAKDNQILERIDFYGETVMHKMIRSNNNYFDIIIEMLPNNKIEKMLNQKSRYGQSPLQMAVAFESRWMLEKLVEQIKNKVKIDDITDNTLPNRSFNSGNGDLEVFISIFKGIVYHNLNNNKSTSAYDDFYAEFERCLIDNQNPFYREKLVWFIEVYNKYIDGITDPELLDSSEYRAMKKNIFDMAKLRMRDENVINHFFNLLEILPDAIYLLDDEIDRDGKRKPFLQIIIEVQRRSVFENILSRVSMNRLRPPGNGMGDYLTIALLNKRLDIMNILLDRYPTNRQSTMDLMNPNTNICFDIADSMNLQSTDPLRIFSIDRILSSNNELLLKMARFYQPRFRDITYSANLLVSLVNNDMYELYDFYLDFDNSFYNVSSLIDGEPVVTVLLNNNQIQLAEKYLNYWKNRSLDKRNRDSFVNIWENNPQFRANNPNLEDLYNEIRNTIDYYN